MKIKEVIEDGVIVDQADGEVQEVTEVAEVNEKTGPCFNEDCMHFDKSLVLGCGCGGENDDPAFDVHGCIHFVQGMVDASKSIPAEAEAVNVDLPLSDSFMYNLPVFLTDVELGHYSKRQAELWTQWGRLNQQKKDSAAVYKKQIESVESQLDEVSRIVEEGSEERPVKCYWMFDYPANEKILVRSDVNHIVERRTLTKEEIERYQNPELFGSEGIRLEESIANVQAAFPENSVGETIDPEDGGRVCGNTECASYNTENANHCGSLEHVYECSSSIVLPDASTTIEENSSVDGVEEVQP
jgi:hypothetical protein